jgi:hypothetical protein
VSLPEDFFEAAQIRGRYILEFVAYPMLSRDATEEEIAESTIDARRRLMDGGGDWCVLNVAPNTGRPDPAFGDETKADVRLLSIGYRNVESGLSFHVKGFLVNRKRFTAVGVLMYMTGLAAIYSGARIPWEYRSKIMGEENSPDPKTIYIPMSFAKGDTEKLLTVCNLLENKDERRIARG